MNISVLIPARGRSTYLNKSINSLIDLATNSSKIEIIVRLDHDDPQLVENQEVLRGVQCAKHIVGKRLGYWRLNEYYNELAVIATGDHLLLWNDDIDILTIGWDTLLVDAPKFCIQSLRRDLSHQVDGTLPCMSRSVYEAIGHFSAAVYSDRYLSQVGTDAGVLVYRNDIIFHHYCLTAVERGSVDSQNEIGKIIDENYISEKSVAIRVRDARLIREAIKRT